MRCALICALSGRSENKVRAAVSVQVRGLHGGKIKKGGVEVVGWSRVACDVGDGLAFGFAEKWEIST